MCDTHANLYLCMVGPRLPNKTAHHHQRRRWPWRYTSITSRSSITERLLRQFWRWQMAQLSHNNARTWVIHIYSQISRLIALSHHICTICSLWKCRNNWWQARARAIIRGREISRATRARTATSIILYYISRVQLRYRLAHMYVYIWQRV